MNNTNRSGDGVIILFNLLFAGVATLGLLIGGWSSVATVLTVAVYFTISSSLFVLATTGGLRDILLELIVQSSNLARLVIVGWYSRRSQRAAAASQILDLEQDFIETMPTVGTSFVPASPQGSQHATRQQARAWLLSLFDEKTGQLRHDKVHMTNSRETDGWLKVPAPTGDVRSLLVASGLLALRQNGLAIARDKIAYIEDIDKML